MDSKQADPDLIRNDLPEIGGYIREDPLRAGSQTHREAGCVRGLGWAGLGWAACGVYLSGVVGCVREPRAGVDVPAYDVHFKPHHHPHTHIFPPT
jgi:hypothetical protein